MNAHQRLAHSMRDLMAASRLTKIQRAELADIADDLETLADESDTGELHAMLVSLHEQAHGPGSIRVCTDQPCRESSIDFDNGPAQWAFL